ncbi:MAG TPA: hypothetical protein VFY25_10140 [Anaerolineales bacterium]|nr:hypothetical protein [Anaerolineales bacterium]
MPDRTLNPLRKPRARTYHSGNSEARTERTWARIVESYEDVPGAYKQLFGTYFSKEQSFPYTVLTPSYERFGYRITEKLVSVFDDEIQILESNEKNERGQHDCLDDISYVEVSSILLESRVKISGITRQGISASSILRFSSATDYLFAPILRKIRLHTVVTTDVMANSECEKFDDWIHLNYKFMNLARGSLLGVEKVVCAILQPEIQKSLLTILGKRYYRTISPAHATILTDRELIMIREEALQGRKDKYGGIWEYIPLSNIASLSLSGNTGSLLKLLIQLRTDEHFEYLYQASRQNELDDVVKQFGRLRSRE